MRPTLQQVLDLSSNKVNQQKLRKLRKLLEVSLARDLSSVKIDDPMVIRRSLVAQMRADGTSAGMIQAFEQFFMGVVRRAAVDGIIPAPPEGPWTFSWQSVLDFAGQQSAAKSAIRSIAGWATDRGLDPTAIRDADLRKWAGTTKNGPEATLEVCELLQSWSQTNAKRFDSKTLTERLMRKASGGTVQPAFDDGTKADP